jgi:protein-S-isoprenylcysteine O-methyltransferase Ste14
VQTEPDVTTRIGGWLFRHRSSIPLPFVLAILVIPGSDAWRSSSVLGLGVVVTLAGEALRLWGVHHIGVISRTRSDRLGPLVDTGPFGFVRNPLYIGNILLWIGFAVTARLVWLAPVVLVLLGAEYHAIVRWEEQLLEAKRGQEYRDYRSRVPRWIPTFERRVRRDHRANNSSADSAVSAFKPHSLGETLFSERGTLLAIAAGYVLLWLKK